MKNIMVSLLKHFMTDRQSLIVGLSYQFEHGWIDEVEFEFRLSELFLDKEE